jgi:D-arabinose 5-phosphate isomerase GutQ
MAIRMPDHHDDRLPRTVISSSEASTDQGSLDWLVPALNERSRIIDSSVRATLADSMTDVLCAVAEVEQWIRVGEIVRVVGAGRTRLAVAISANRLAHAGVNVFLLHDAIPLPSSAKGGAIVAASASGRTSSVINLMTRAKLLNSDIRILGISNRDAAEFADLCDIFIGISEASTHDSNPLRGLADTSEHVISQILDAIVAAAAKQAGLDEDDLRGGHEDLGDTGPYSQEE